VRRRLASVGVLLAAAGVVTACEPTPSTPAVFASISSWQSTTWAWAKLVRTVSNVGNDGLIVRERDSGRVVPGVLLCKYGGTDVPCSAAKINGIRMMPDAPFRFGEQYRVEFATRFLDTASRPPIVGDVLFRAGPREEDQGPTPVFTWPVRPSAGALGGSYSVEDRAQARATLPFAGSSVTVLTATSSTHGLMDLYVDGVLRRTADTYSPVTRFRVPVAVTGLTPGAHRLDVVAQGNKGNPASRGTNVVLDAVSWPGGSADASAFEFAWGAGSAPSFSQGWAASSQLAGGSTDLAFRGAAIDVATVRGPWSGIFSAYLDGRLLGTFDDGSSSFGPIVRHYTAPADGVHSLRMVVAGQHSTHAIASGVAIDYWQVPATPRDPAARTGPTLPDPPPEPQQWNRTDFLPAATPSSNGAGR
jgi:hypothetical protein